MAAWSDNLEGQVHQHGLNLTSDCRQSVRITVGRVDPLLSRDTCVHRGYMQRFPLQRRQHIQKAAIARGSDLKCSHMPVQGVQYADLPYFVGLATLTIYIGAHRGLSSRNRQQLSMQQVRCLISSLDLLSS